MDMLSILVLLTTALEIFGRGICEAMAAGQGSEQLMLLADDADPCSEYAEKNCEGSAIIERYFYEKGAQTCISKKTKACDGVDSAAGFDSLEFCKEECVKIRQPRRLPAENKFSILSDFEISAPNKLSPGFRRKFPLAFCELQRDGGLLCPGIRRGNYIDQFFYDGKTNSCQHFVYSGCGGNANRFSSIWECIQSCVRKSTSLRRF